MEQQQLTTNVKEIEGIPDRRSYPPLIQDRKRHLHNLPRCTWMDGGGVEKRTRSGEYRIQLGEKVTLTVLAGNSQGGKH